MRFNTEKRGSDVIETSFTTGDDNSIQDNKNQSALEIKLGIYLGYYNKNFGIILKQRDICDLIKLPMHLILSDVAITSWRVSPVVKDGALIMKYIIYRMLKSFLCMKNIYNINILILLLTMLDFNISLVLRFKFLSLLLIDFPSSCNALCNNYTGI